MNQPSGFGTKPILSGSNVGIPLQYVKTDVLAVETTLQKQLCPSQNWPHIVPCCKNNIQRQQYSLPMTKANVIPGQTVMKRWRKLCGSTSATALQIQRQHNTLEDKYRLLYALGSDTIQNSMFLHTFDSLQFQHRIFSYWNLFGHNAKVN